MLSLRDSLPNLRNNLRFLHAAPGIGAIDIYTNNKILAKNISFSDVTDYINIAPGNHKLEIYKTGTTTNPISDEDIVLIPGGTNTISLILQESELVTLNLHDGRVYNTQPSISSNLRFINLSPNSPLLSLSVTTGTTLFNGVEYLETTNYYQLSARIYDFVLSSSTDSSFRKYIQNSNLEQSDFYTLYIIGLVNETPRLGSLFLRDGK